MKSGKCGSLFWWNWWRDGTHARHCEFSAINSFREWCIVSILCYFMSNEIPLRYQGCTVYVLKTLELNFWSAFSAVVIKKTLTERWYVARIICKAFETIIKCALMQVGPSFWLSEKCWEMQKGELHSTRSSLLRIRQLHLMDVWCLVLFARFCTPFRSGGSCAYGGRCYCYVSVFCKRLAFVPIIPVF